MAERNYPVPDNPVYDANIRALQNSDEANADTVFNPLLAQLISNIHAVKLLADSKAGSGDMQAKLTDIANTLNTINTALNGKAAADHTHTPAQAGAAAASHGHSAATAQAAGFMAAADKSKLDGIAAKATANATSTTTPKALGTASAGSEAAFARGDHVHPKPTLADLGAAASSHNHTKSQITDFPTSMAPTAHNHSAANITSGILTIARGGTGANTLTSGAALIGNGTGAIQTRAITHLTTAGSSIPQNTNLITAQTLALAMDRTNPVHAANTAYTTVMARGISASTSTPSSITNGCIHLTYS